MGVGAQAVYRRLGYLTLASDERYHPVDERIEYFGGRTSGRIVLKGDQPAELSFQRELWFDRDVDGRWLVGVADPTSAPQERLGAIVVKDVAIGLFIELLGQLIADPDKFADEPVLVGPGWIGRWPT
jgi:hypothetical protein